MGSPRKIPRSWTKASVCSSKDAIDEPSEALSAMVLALPAEPGLGRGRGGTGGFCLGAEMQTRGRGRERRISASRWPGALRVRLHGLSTDGKGLPTSLLGGAVGKQEVVRAEEDRREWLE